MCVSSRCARRRRAARAPGVCSRPPRGRARFRRPRGWPAVRTGRGAAVAGRGRARHGRRRRRRRAPRRRTTDGRRFQPKLSADTSGRTARDAWSKPGPGELRSSFIPQTRLLHPDARCCSVICQPGHEAQTWCWPEPYLIRRRNGGVAPRFTSPRALEEEGWTLSGFQTLADLPSKLKVDVEPARLRIDIAAAVLISGIDTQP